MKEHDTILVIGESASDGLSATTREVLRIAGRITTSLGKRLILCLFGGETPTGAVQGYAMGADEVHLVVDPLLAPYTAEAYLQAAAAVVQGFQPGAVLLGHTDKGMDLAPRLAFRLKTGVAMDCVDIIADSQNQRLTFVKPVFGGKAHSHLLLADHFPQIATIREGAFDPADMDVKKTGQAQLFPLSLDPSSMKIRFIRKETDENLALANRLTTAPIVVCAGRGVKNQQGVDLVSRTAALLDGAVAATRPVVDSGWLPYALQVGLTGKKVHPQLYIAAGISGAVQHMAGCLKSKTIVAINNDDSAPIFKMAHYGVVGDLKKVLEGFNAQVEKAAANG